jgi:transcriptional regulator with XRE-family HTH domain
MTTKEALVLSGHNLRSLRKLKGYSLAALAVLSGVPEAKITGCEDGEFDVPPEVVFELAAALNVDIREFMVDPTPHQ